MEDRDAKNKQLENVWRFYLGSCTLNPKHGVAGDGLERVEVWTSKKSTVQFVLTH